MCRSTTASEPGRNTRCTQSGEENITSKCPVVAKARAERENEIVMEVSSTKERPQAPP